MGKAELFSFVGTIWVMGYVLLGIQERECWAGLGMHKLLT